MKDNDSFSESMEEEQKIEYELEENTNTIMLYSIWDNTPATIYFQYNFSVNKSQKSEARTYIVNWENNKKYCVLFKAYKNVPECILGPMKDNGIIRCKSFIRANIIWKLLKIDKMSILIKKLNKYQRFNHFPSTWQIGRKDNLWKNYKAYNKEFPEDFNYIPFTYIIPEEHAEMSKAVNDDPNKLWIVKPVASSRGRGIRLFTTLNTLPKKCLISQYIYNPHIINNKKYDLRLYVLVTDFSPLKVYLYEEGLVRFASEEYSTSDENKSNKFMHLTNYSVNKISGKFDNELSTDNECKGSKWSLTALKLYFKEKGVNFEPTWERIKDIIVKTFITITDESIKHVKKLTKSKNNLFELYGFDILLDSNVQPWLLEVNLNPSLACESDLDLKVKSSVMCDIFTTIGVVPYSHTKHNRKSPEIMFDSTSKYDTISQMTGDSYITYNKNKESDIHQKLKNEYIANGLEIKMTKSKILLIFRFSYDITVP
jgi:tubulin polyglutamylase TTLL4